MTPQVSLDPVEPAGRAVVENLFQLYVHDFSDFMAAQVELGEDGRFPPYPPLAAYFEGRDDHRPFLIRTEGRIAGLVLANRTGHSGRAVDWNVAEFFVVRKHRRGGVATRAAHALWLGRPGVWEAAIARRNLPALSFWRKAVAGCPGVSQIEEVDHTTEEWNGPILRFRIEG